MAKGINKVTLLGNVGGAPEKRVTQAGATIVTCSLATTGYRYNKETQKSEDVTEWHRLVFFDALAEVVYGRVAKGDKLYAEGALKTRSWDDGGVKHYRTDINVKQIVLLGARRDTAEPDAPATVEEKAIDVPEDDIPF